MRLHSTLQIESCRGVIDNVQIKITIFVAILKMIEVRRVHNQQVSSK